MRTKEEINAEIQALEACKAYVPKTNAFGENNHTKLDLQMQFLRGDIDTTADEFNDMQDWERDAVLEAENWKNGDDPDTPSSGWDPFKYQK